MQRLNITTWGLVGIAPTEVYIVRYRHRPAYSKEMMNIHYSPPLARTTTTIVANLNSVILNQEGVFAEANLFQVGGGIGSVEFVGVPQGPARLPQHWCQAPRRPDIGWDGLTYAGFGCHTFVSCF